VRERVPFPYLTGVDGVAQSQIAQNLQTIKNTLLERDRQLLLREKDIRWSQVSTPTNYFTNSWVNYSLDYYQEAQYRRIGDVVEIRGTMKNGTDSATAFTLPPGYRPVGHHLYPEDASGPTHARLNVLSDGTISVQRGGAPYYSDVMARFSVAADGSAGWKAVTAFENSWTNFGGGWAPAAYRRVGDMVEVRGLITGGTVGSTANVFTLPTGYRPIKRFIFPIDTNPAVNGRLEVRPDGGIRIHDGSNVYAGLFTIRFSVSPPGTNGWTKMVFENGWENLDVAVYTPGEWRLIGDELQTRGVIANGSTLAAIFTLPDELIGRLTRNQSWTQSSGSGSTETHGLLAAFADGSFYQLGGGVDYFSMNASYTVRL